jgi:membrane protein DedA with SNARE-associated domain
MLVLASISESLVNLAWHFVRDAGLPAVFVLMVAESACIPIPSEATMLFAGFAVADPGASSAHHHLTLAGIVVAGVLGNLVGSWIAYGIGRAGRLELVERHGRWLHLKPSHIAWADRWFARYGDPAIFFSRMLPIVRTFISLPAGIAKMPALPFGIYTTLGCLPWTTALAVAGYAVGKNWESIVNAFHGPTYIIAAVVLVALVILAWRYVRSRRPDDGSADGGGQDGGGHSGDRDGERTRGAHRQTRNGSGLSGR